MRDATKTSVVDSLFIAVIVALLLGVGGVSFERTLGFSFAVWAAAFCAFYLKRR